MALPFLHVVEDLEAQENHVHEKIRWLQIIFNGSWQSTTPIHYCGLACPCGASSPEEVRHMAQKIFCGFILSSRPPIPALAKWAKCGLTARWFFLASCVHSLLQRGIDELYGISSRNSLQSACQELGHELSVLANDGNTSSDTSTLDAVSAFALPDLPIPKILRVRALKAANWLLSEHAVADLAVAIAATEPAESIVEWLFREQHESWSWLRIYGLF